MPMALSPCSTNYSSRLEEDPFPSGGGPTADYAFMLFFGAVILWVRIRYTRILCHRCQKANDLS